MVIDFSLQLFESVTQPSLYDVVVKAYNDQGEVLEAKSWMGLSAHKAQGMFSAFRVRVVKQYNPKVDDPPADIQLELPF